MEYTWLGTKDSSGDLFRNYLHVLGRLELVICVPRDFVLPVQHEFKGLHMSQSPRHLINEMFGKIYYAL